jgi:hypothetical protein
MSANGLFKKKELLNSIVGSLLTTKSVKKVWCLEVEQAIFNWFKVMKEHGITLSNDLVVVATKILWHGKELF